MVNGFNPGSPALVCRVNRPHMSTVRGCSCQSLATVSLLPQATKA